MFEKKRKAPSTAFKPGQSGNPSGRPKIPKEIREAAKAHTQDALNTLAEIMMDPAATHTARVQAADKLLERGWGKATQYIETKIGVLDNLSDEQLTAINAALATLAGDSDSTGEGSSEAYH